MRLSRFSDGLEVVIVAFLLVLCGVVVGAQTIADQHPAVITGEHLDHHGPAAMLVHHIEGCGGRGEDPEPPTGSPHPPTGFVGMHHLAASHLAHQGIVGGVSLRPTRWAARASPPGLKRRPKWSESTAWVLRRLRPLALLRSKASARARGPKCTPAAPTALET